MLVKRLKEARVRAGLTQYKLGLLAGMEETTSSARMNQYEKGKHQPDQATASRIAQALGLPLAWFYAEENDLADAILRYWQQCAAGTPE
ncbi:XRE family transcriptional regulator [Chimaeribacter arupi]|uniref:XRE family transcriptional regulator n=2 Tax=Yersiniaceae TaxID=1903411 RepID=A0A2N5EIJ2_9GAMM|nr:MULTISPECIES: helix-turn-helix transcriptional regulator [Yersiniaceae]MBS0968190.1 helix-turn-helix transcriptional regulator [Nissabacter archeti]PLR31621.1 XRE family transcriptional regulator [Chimaeribacter arupi]PLR44660.1 XRE family transcriptional regulator [Chimaeribacter arupi]PLR44737.1 XRE family transcriptional regulator [Chimaeribacter arupi]PLR47110.1 XRE family transcriptional regulator [Chimaeribacter arupi]